MQPRSLARPLLFIGQITALGPVFQGVCKSAVNQTVDFAISEVLLGDLSEDTFHYGYPNCSWQNSPSPPFTLHKPVILFCHHHTYCFEPLPVTPERLASIRDWLADATRSDDAAPFAQLKQGIKKANPLRASSVLIFEGEIVRIQPTGTGLCESLKGREDDIKIDHALFGETEKGRIAASNGSVNCPIPLSVRLHAKVIVYGALQLPANQSCLPPVDATTENLAAVNSWTAQPSHQGSQAADPKP